MKNNFSYIILPPIIGIVCVLIFSLTIELIIYGLEIIQYWYENSFLQFCKFILIPATLLAIIIQKFAVLPLFKRFKESKKIIGLNLIPFTGFLCFVFSILIGFLFWEKTLGIIEFLVISLVCFFTLSVFWTCNLMILNFLMKK